MADNVLTRNNERSVPRNNLGKFLLLLKSAGVVAVVTGLRLVAAYFGWNFITYNSLVGSFVSGVFFTIGIILAGVVTDYKEAEKIPTELAVLLKGLRHDARFIATQCKEQPLVDGLSAKVEKLLYAINDNFRDNHWHKSNLDVIFNAINDDLFELGRRGAPLFSLTRVRDSVNNIDRLSHRTDFMIETNFIPAAYMVASVATASVMLIFIFTPEVWQAGSWVITSLVMFVMVSVFLLIRDIDNPFEYGKTTCADVDLSVLFKLEELWQKNRGEN